MKLGTSQAFPLAYPSDKSSSTHVFHTSNNSSSWEEFGHATNATTSVTPTQGTYWPRPGSQQWFAFLVSHRPQKTKRWTYNRHTVSMYLPRVRAYSQTLVWAFATDPFPGLVQRIWRYKKPGHTCSILAFPVTFTIIVWFLPFRFQHEQDMACLEDKDPTETEKAVWTNPKIWEVL